MTKSHSSYPKGIIPQSPRLGVLRRSGAKASGTTYLGKSSNKSGYPERVGPSLPMALCTPFRVDRVLNQYPRVDTAARVNPGLWGGIPLGFKEWASADCRQSDRILT